MPRRDQDAARTSRSQAGWQTTVLRATPAADATREVASDDDLEARARASRGLRRELKDLAVERDGIVPGHDAPLLVTQDFL